MNIKLISIVLMVAMALVSCENYLNTLPPDAATPQTFLQNKQQAQTLLVGIYNELYVPAYDATGYDQNYYSGLPIFAYENMTDNCYNPHPWEGATEFGAGTQTADSWLTICKWNSNWRAISRANSLILGIKDVKSMSETDKQSVVAEAKFLRAYFYFDLICFYGDVPLLDENAPKTNPARVNKDTVMSWVYSDVDYAIANLPQEYGGDRANKGAALMLKMRMLQWQHKYADVISVCKQIETLQYELNPSYSGLFTDIVTNSNSSKEIIFKLNYAKNKISSNISILVQRWGSYNVTLQAVEAYYTANGRPIKNIVTKDGAIILGDPSYNPDRYFENRDPRFSQTIWAPGDEFKCIPQGRDFPHATPNQRDGIVSSFSLKKYVNENIVDDTNESTDKILMRYGEVLLAWAEAENEVNGPTNVAYDKINRIRNRVGMITLTDAMPSLSKEQMREVIHNEFRVELFFEGRRWFDIRRWGIAQDVMVDAMGYDVTKLKTFSNYDITSDWKYVPIIINKRSFNPDRDYLWPIPNSEIYSNNNPGMVQNPNYN